MPDANRSILIVEDDETERYSLSRLLTQEGYEVECVESCAAAEEHLSRNRLPSLILLDMLLPGMNGFEFLTRKRRTTPRWRRVPVIILSGMAARITGDLGACAVLQKPYDTDALLSAVRECFP